VAQNSFVDFIISFRSAGKMLKHVGPDVAKQKDLNQLSFLKLWDPGIFLRKLNVEVLSSAVQIQVVKGKYRWLYRE
jgi:hypothetical protein